MTETVHWTVRIVAVEDDNQTFINYTVTNETVIVPENPIHWGVPKIPGCPIDETPWHPGMHIPINLTPGELILPMNTTPLHPVIAVNPVVKVISVNQTPLCPIGPEVPIFPIPRPTILIPSEPGKKLYSANFGAVSNSVLIGWLAL